MPDIKKGNDMSKQYLISEEQKEQYKNIIINEGIEKANEFGALVVKALDLDYVGRSKAWAELKEVVPAAKRIAAANKRTVGKVVKEIIAKKGNSLNARECQFLESIKNKRTLTEKQNKWLLDIAKATDVSGPTIEVKPSKNSRIDCDHGDLGSLGYMHGSIVKCPGCGSMVEVW